jgi:hypothetical protein
MITIIDTAVHIAKGCHDFNGGYHANDPYATRIYHHGIQTVINALEEWRWNVIHGGDDHQVNTLARIGALEDLTAESQELGLYDSPLPIELL